MVQWGGPASQPSSVATTLRSRFFFSSRFRHSMCGRVCSADVCSFDLSVNRVRSQALSLRWFQAHSLVCNRAAVRRSEERRVGKDSKSRWPPSHLTKNNLLKYQVKLRPILTQLDHLY